MMTISCVMLVLALSCSAFAAPSAPMTCSEAAVKNLGLKTNAADNLCNSCSSWGVAPCPLCARCKSCIKAAGTYAEAQACLPKKSPKPPSPPVSPPKIRNPAPPAGTPAPLTCSGAVQKNLGVSKATADGYCLACPTHNQSECKACVKAAMTKADAKACPANTA